MYEPLLNKRCVPLSVTLHGELKTLQNGYKISFLRGKDDDTRQVSLFNVYLTLVHTYIYYRHYNIR